jgi:hypothetical protein
MDDRIYIPPIVAEAVHIDTIRLTHYYRSCDLPSPIELQELGFELTTKEREVDNKVTTAHPKIKNATDPYITVINSSNVNSYSGVTIECSLAKLVNKSGMGAQKEEDIECGRDAIEDYVRGKLGIDFNCYTARVGRLDVNADFRVGEERIPLYIKTISTPSGRFRTAIVGNTTKYFTNKSGGYAIYGKQAEMKEQLKERRVTQEYVLAAEGILRIEKRLYKPQPIRRFAQKLNIEPVAGQLLTQAVAVRLITEALFEMNLNEMKHSNDARNYQLLDCFGKKAAEMVGILEYSKLFGDDCWKKLGCSKQTFEKKKRALKKANLWDVSPDEALPALVIPNAYNNFT